MCMCVQVSHVLTEEDSLLLTVSVGFWDGLSIYVSLLVCMYADIFFLYELTLCPGKLWHFGLESRKMQKDKAHEIPLLQPA